MHNTRAYILRTKMPKFDEEANVIVVLLSCIVLFVCVVLCIIFSFCSGCTPIGLSFCMTLSYD